MKKFVLHCKICTVVTRFLNVNFVPIQKEDTLGTRLISKKLFLSESANCFNSDRFRRNSPTVQNGPEKTIKALFS